MPRTSSQKAFSLVELITGIMILSIIGLAGWFANSILFHESETTRNSEIAVNLLQKSQEELRRVAQIHFDRLEQCSFLEGNLCGFQTLSAEFDGFDRALSVEQEGSSELKRVLITVRWNELGQEKAISSLLILSKPADPLPGNIIGLVTDKETKDIVGNANITISRDGSAELHSVFSQNAVTQKAGNNINYDFKETGTDRFFLVPGSWSLSANHSSYRSYSHPGLVTVNSNSETVVNFEMESLPEDGRLRARLADVNTGVTVSFNSLSYIELYERSSRLTRKNNTSTLDFDVHFTTDNQRCFTLRTTNAYLSSLSGNFSCEGLSLSPQGWSSAVVQDDSSLICSNPWNGNEGSDRICIGPGEDRTVVIPLAPVPTAQAHGFVLDQEGKPIPDAEIYVYWHENNVFGPRPAGLTDESGFYRVAVPAEQALFQNIASNYPRIEARARASVVRCCDTPTFETRSASMRVQGPVFPGDDRPVNNIIVNLASTTSSCGDADGKIINDKTESLISGAVISVTGINRTTSGGFYLYNCPETGYRLPVGNHNFTVNQGSFYPFFNGGNVWYTATARIGVLANVLRTQSDVQLWPIGRGTIRVNVIDAATGANLPNAIVTLRTHNTSGTAVTLSMNSDSGGTATFVNVLESWPVENFTSGNPRYNQTVRTHSLEVHHSEVYDDYSQSGILLISGETKDIEVRLIPKGQM